MISAQPKAGEAFMAPNILYMFWSLIQIPSAFPAFPIGHLIGIKLLTTQNKILMSNPGPPAISVNGSFVLLVAKVKPLESPVSHFHTSYV